MSQPEYHIITKTYEYRFCPQINPPPPLMSANRILGSSMMDGVTLFTFLFRQNVAVHREKICHDRCLTQSQNKAKNL
jgi:hypothetical protein